MPHLPTMQRWRIVAITYELQPDGASWLPVVRHEFYGATAEQAIGIRASHLRADSFLAQCQNGHFGRVTCQTQWYPPEEVL
jgi:hypothetical protein